MWDQNGSTPSPPFPGQAEPVASLEERLAAGRAQLAAQDLRAALATFTEVGDRARLAGDRKAQAAALRFQGVVRFYQSEVEHAIAGAERVNHENLRVVDDKGEPILYPKELFDVLDPTLPAGWLLRDYPDGEYYLDPAATSSPGFYEDFFGSDGDWDAQERARQSLREALEAAMAGGNDEDKRLLRRDLERLGRL